MIGHASAGLTAEGSARAAAYAHLKQAVLVLLMRVLVRVEQAAGTASSLAHEHRPLRGIRLTVYYRLHFSYVLYLHI